MKHLTIRRRILISFIAIVFISSILQLVIAGRQLQLATLEFYQHHLETDALMIATTLSEPLEKYHEGEGTSGMRQLLVNLQKDDGHEYLIVDRSYHIIGYTAGTGYETLDRVSATPELLLAGQGQIGADTRVDFAGTERLYVAVQIRYEQEPLGYLVLSRPLQPAYLQVYQQWLQLSSTSLPVIILVIGTGLWLASTISHPIQQLRNSALKMADGALDTRIAIQAEDEIGQLAHAFNYMAERLEGLLKTQRSFVSNAAHELRTPLMTLKLRVEALQDDTLPITEHTAYLAELRKEIDHMAELVASLLVLARIDEGRHQVDTSLTDTSSALRDIARHWRIEAKQANLEFEATIPADLPKISLTPNDLRLILDNLLGNAVKYTRQGKICFTVHQRDDQLSLQIQDTGAGFDPAITQHLFTRFYRADTARAEYEGNGLGLSIVAILLAHYGGTVSAASAGAGTGATFTVMLPVANPVEPRQLRQSHH